MNRSAAALSIAFLGAIALGGCLGDGSFLVSDKDSGTRPSVDAGVAASSDAGAQVREPILREDFSTREWVDTTSVAVVDVNRGIVSLPAEPFPELVGGMMVTYDQRTQLDGVAEGSTIVVLESSEINASDSVELRAQDSLRVAGRIRAGAGGVTLVAGRELLINGAIESEGPITLRLTSETGLISIGGTVSTLNRDAYSSSPILIRARGGLSVSGELHTGAASYGDSGAIDVITYGPIVVAGRTAALRTGLSAAGDSGGIQLSTEQTIQILDGAVVEIGESSGSPGPALKAGSVTMRSERIQVRGARIEGGHSTGGLAGAVRFTCSSTMTLDGNAQILGGFGRIGGDVHLEAGTASVGIDASVLGGDGIDTSGRAWIDASGDLELRAAEIAGGSGHCGDGADALLQIGGRIFAAAPLILRGGNGGTDVGSSCFGTYRGGSVQVIAQDVIGPLRENSQGGTGTSSGAVNIETYPLFTRPTPDIHVRPVGWVISKRIDRGVESLNLPVRLIELRPKIIEDPNNTLKAIQVSGADDSNAELVWVNLDVGMNQYDERLIRQRYIRYRVLLRGRALDTPIVDYFELAFGQL